MICGLDASTSIVGYAFTDDGKIYDAGFLNISKLKTNKEKANAVVDLLKKTDWKISHINLEAALSGFGGGLTSQQTIITLSRWNAILEYVLSEAQIQAGGPVPIVLCNVNSVRKKIFGKCRIKGIKPKEFVKMELEKLYPNIHDLDKKNRRNEFDKHNYDMYDAICLSLYG